MPQFVSEVYPLSFYSRKPPAPVPAQTQTTAPPPNVQSTSTETPTSIDEEVAKRKARAARFNIDYVEPKKSNQQRQKKEKISTVPPSEVSIRLYRYLLFC